MRCPYDLNSAFLLLLEKFACGIVTIAIVLYNRFIKLLPQYLLGAYNFIAFTDN